MLFVHVSDTCCEVLRFDIEFEKVLFFSRSAEQG
jgi:hypothetical protein